MKRKRFRITSITVKSIIAVIVVSVVLILIATPVMEAVAVRAISPLFKNHVIAVAGWDSHTMSTFLARSNNALRHRFRDEKTQEYLSGYFYGEPGQTDIESRLREKLGDIYSAIENANGKVVESVSYPMIVSENGVSLYSPEIAACAEAFLGSDWFGEYKADRERPFRTYAPLVTVEENGEETAYFACVSTFTDEERGETYFSAVFTDFETVKELMDGCIGMGIDDYMLMCGDDIIYQNTPEDSAIDVERFEKYIMSDTQHYVISLSGETDIDCSVLMSSQREELRLVMHVTENDLIDSQRGVLTVIRLVLLVFALVFSAVVMIMLRQIFRRLTVLSKKMSSVRDGDYSVEIEAKRPDEVGRLVDTFNMMTARIRDDIARREEQEKREREMQYNLMVSAINPHFIYNTLNTVTRLAEFGRMRDVVEVNNALIENLRDSLKSKSDSAFDSVSNEKNVLEQYIKIQSYLCENELELVFHIDEKDMELIIPKNVIQPLVENSILHGILMNYDENGVPRDGRIDVTVGRDGDRIKIGVKDNGVGMTQEVMEKYFSPEYMSKYDDRFEHIGIRNINVRLSYLYNDDFTITVESERGKGTNIVVTVPKEQ